MNEAELEKAHKASNDNRETIQQSQTAGCFSCQNLFPAKQVSEFCVDSAICPYCGVDSVIGDASGYPITPEFLKEMNEFWF